MADISDITFFENLTGTENDLNHVLSSFVDSEHEIVSFRDSRYIDMSDIKSVFKQSLSNFHILSLNVQSINAKFDNLFPIINNLSASGLYFGAICLQETWLSSNADISMFHIPGYKLIHQGFRCTKHGGLTVCINEKYSYKLRNLYDKSDVWEGLFIDVNGHNLSKTLTIGNMYRPPHDNNNNKNIEKFIDEISPIIDIIQKENSYAAIVGDFNINLLQVNEREKYAEFLDLMCTNNFFPRITLPTRIAKRSQSLIDQIFCKVPFKDLSDSSASVVLSAISDHFPCVVNFKILNKKQLPPKYVNTRKISDQAIKDFRDDLLKINISSHLNSNLMVNPNSEYEKFDDIIQNFYHKHFPEKREKFNKYKHKISNWITSGIIKSIEFRDNLYKKWKMSPHDSPDYSILGHNLKLYNKYLNQCIRTAKQEFYMREFAKYKNDIRKTWDTLKHILNKKKSKSEFPPYFIDKNRRISGSQNIADQFNEYFIQIGPKLAGEIDTANKLPFDSYLQNPTPSSFQFNYTTPIDVEKIISNLKPKSSCGYDNISSKLLKYTGDIVSVPLSIIVNQSLCTGIFPDKLKIAKVIPLYKKQDEKVFGNYRPISLLSSVSKVFERIVFDQLYDYFTTNGPLFNSQYGFRKHHSTELAALELTDKIRREIDQKKTPFSVYLDLSKAFDTLNHAMLLKKTPTLWLAGHHFILVQKWPF